MSGALLHWQLSAALTATFDASLLARAQALRAHVEHEDGVVEFDEPEEMPAFAPGPDAEYFCMWLSISENVKRSPSLADGLLPRRAGTLAAPDTWDLELPDGRAGRALGVEYALVDADSESSENDAPRLTVVVAVSRAPLDANRAALLVGLASAGALALLLGALLLRHALARSLAPVDRLAARLDALDAAHLAERVGDEPVPAELAPVTAKLDELLARLEEAFARQRRITGAMAHELRTPIAELRSAGDVAARWPDDDGLVDQLVATSGDVALRMSAAVDAVMHYCRLESGEERADLEEFAPAALLDELWQHRAAQAAERGLDFRNALPAELRLRSDRRLLGLVFGNLLHNAVSFASGGRVSAALTAVDNAAAAELTLEISNHTDQLGPEDLERLHEPFWRKDAARSDGAHSGLGLTLVAAVLEQLGGSLNFRLESGRFTASVTLPGARITTP